MVQKKYGYIVYFIALTVLATLCAQAYWLVKNYDINKQQVINQIKTSFDQSVEKYYNELAKENSQTLISTDTVIEGMPKRLIIKNVDPEKGSEKFKNIDSFLEGDNIKIRSVKNPTDSVEIENVDPSDLRHVAIYKMNNDSITDIHNLSAKIILSFNKRDIDLENIDSIFRLQLKRKKISLNYALSYLRKNNSNWEVKNELNLNKITSSYQTIIAQSSFIPFQSKLELRYTDLNFSIFKRISLSIVLSFILSGIIIGCLFFLLKIIFKQKQLSELKNDLINNITHEFKTPIATITAALEAIQNFNFIQKPEKTEEYINISNRQLDKLNVMIEKLLETASLHTEELKLQKESVDLKELIHSCVEKFQVIAPDKNLIFNSERDLLIDLDKFHFENAINNIIDNAIKYGGEAIYVHMKENGEIIIEDNGPGLSRTQQKNIFEQFYRIPTGNVHNIRGFGIGLYYSRIIIEKHGGRITASDSRPGRTIIKVKITDE